MATPNQAPNPTEQGGEKSISAGVAIAGLIASVIGNIISTERTNRLNRELAEKENAWNLEQWQRETAYNSPAAQMQRLLSAGLNPSLMYEGGNFSNSAASSPDFKASLSPMERVEFDPTAMASTISSIHQNELMDSQTRLNEAQARETEERANLQNVEAHRKSVLLPYEEKQFQKTADLLDAQTMHTINMAYNVDADTYKKRLEAFYLPKLNDATIHEMESRWKLNEREFYEKVDTFRERVNWLQIHNQLGRAQTSEAWQHANLYKQQSLTEQKQQTLLEWQGNKMVWDARNAKLTFQLNRKYGNAERFLGLAATVQGITLTEQKILTEKSTQKMLDQKARFYKHKVPQEYIKLGLQFRRDNQQFLLGMGKIGSGFMLKTPTRGGWNGITH